MEVWGLVGVVLDEEAGITSEALAGAPLVNALSSLAVGLSTKYAVKILPKLIAEY